MVIPQYPFTGKFLDLDGLKYHYLDEGSGEPVVMVHGNPTWSFYYRNLVLALRDKYRCIVPDHIGCGLSDKPPDSRYPYTLERRASDLEALLEHLGVTSGINLIVHDWGGMIGMTYAHWNPERIRGLVILNTAAFHLPSTRKFPWQLMIFRNKMIGPTMTRGLNLFCRGALKSCSIRGLDPDTQKGYLLPYDNWSNRIAVLRFVQDIPLRPKDRAYQLVGEVEKSLSRFAETPTLICWGAKDFVFDDHFLQVWKEKFPHAEVHRFAEAGHYVLEDAGDQIIPLVKNFLERI